MAVNSEPGVGTEQTFGQFLDQTADGLGDLYGNDALSEYRRDDAGRVGVTGALALVGVAAIGVAAAIGVDRAGIVDLPIPEFNGGEPDHAARGDVIYEGQTPVRASDDFFIDIGDGEARVSVQAQQDWDHPGTVLNGDWQSTNGTASVSNPDDRDRPASITVDVDYCVEGTLTTVDTPNTETGVADRTVSFDMGELFICEADIADTADNQAAFHQDDTPSDFQGRFNNFVTGAIETTAVAAECPEDLSRYTDESYVNHVQAQLAERFGVRESSVEVTPPTIATTDEATQEQLREELESYANARDPEDPDQTYEGLTIDLGSAGNALEDSCYRETSETPLSEINEMSTPQPEPEDQV